MEPLPISNLSSTALTGYLDFRPQRQEKEQKVTGRSRSVSPKRRHDPYRTQWCERTLPDGPKDSGHGSRYRSHSPRKRASQIALRAESVSPVRIRQHLHPQEKETFFKDYAKPEWRGLREMLYGTQSNKEREEAVKIEEARDWLAAIERKAAVSPQYRFGQSSEPIHEKQKKIEEAKEWLAIIGKKAVCVPQSSSGQSSEPVHKEKKRVGEAEDWMAAFDKEAGPDFGYCFGQSSEPIHKLGQKIEDAESWWAAIDNEVGVSPHDLMGQSSDPVQELEETTQSEETKDRPPTMDKIADLSSQYNVRGPSKSLLELREAMETLTVLEAFDVAKVLGSNPMQGKGRAHQKFEKIHREAPIGGEAGNILLAEEVARERERDRLVPLAVLGLKTF